MSISFIDSKKRRRGGGGGRGPKKPSLNRVKTLKIVLIHYNFFVMTSKIVDRIVDMSTVCS